MNNLKNRYFYLNLLLNSSDLQRIFEKSFEDKDTETIFKNLSDRQLYSRLLSDIKFNDLSKKEKGTFLFLNRNDAKTFNLNRVYLKRMQGFVQEAHNRTCKTLGIPATNVIMCDFSESQVLKNIDYTTYDFISGNIYVDNQKDYSVERPSFILEQLNAATASHNNHFNMTKAFKNLGCDDTQDYISMSWALQIYIYEKLREKNKGYLENIKENSKNVNPNYINEMIFGINQTRKDFQRVGLYGGKLRDQLRENEEMFYEYLSENGCLTSIINFEDLISYFDYSPLNRTSENSLLVHLKNFDRQRTGPFYNRLGANFKENESTTEFLDRLNEKVNRSEGVIFPPIDTQEFKKNLDEIVNQLKKKFIDENGEDFKDLFEKEISEEISEELHFKDFMSEKITFKNIIPKENHIDLIDKLPFHSCKEQKDMEQ